MQLVYSGIKRQSLVRFGLFFVAIVAVTVLRTASASAATCGVNTGSVHSLAGLVVESYWWPYTGGTLPSNNTQVRVTTIPNGRPLTGDIVHLNSQDRMSGPRGDDFTFNQYGSGCGDGYNMVLGYNQTSSRSDGYGGPWALDCEASKYGLGNEQHFQITGVGVPSGARAGGTWEVKDFQSKNGYTGYVTIAYREPPPPTTPATLWTSSSVSPNWINPGSNAYFTHQVTISNYGGQNAGVSADVYRSINGQPWSPVRDSGWAGGYFVAAGNYTVTIWNGNVPTVGVNSICQMLVITNAGGANVGSNNAIACANVRSGGTSAGSAVGTSYVEAGQSTTLSGWMQTSGYPATTDPAAAYPVGCSYAVTATLPSSSAITQAAGNCSQTISGNGTIPVVNYATPTNLPIGTQLCVTVSVNAGVFAGSPATSISCTIVVAKPYFTVTGGDISSNGNITSWNVNNVGGAGYAGAGGQLAALATGNITGFVTGTGMSGNPSGLAFANTATGGSTYGGGYMATRTPPVVSTAGATALGASPSLASLNGVYTHAGDLTLYGPVPAGKNVTIVLTSGNLYIANDITYSYGSVAQIPRLTVIVQNGNIYVNNNVTEIHGVFYADGAGKGNFYSCATASNAPSTDYNTCNHPLTVYGAVTANKLVLNRTYGSVHASSGTPAAPAENFFYSPEVWLAPAATGIGSSPAIYNSYVSLPPIL